MQYCKPVIYFYLSITSTATSTRAQRALPAVHKTQRRPAHAATYRNDNGQETKAKFTSLRNHCAFVGVQRPFPKLAVSLTHPNMGINPTRSHASIVHGFYGFTSQANLLCPITFLLELLENVLSSILFHFYFMATKMHIKSAPGPRGHHHGSTQLTLKTWSPANNFLNALGDPYLFFLSSFAGV